MMQSSPTTPSSDERAEIVRYARALKGAPFELHGRRSVGIDCYGLPVRVAKACGFYLPDYVDYGRKATFKYFFPKFLTNFVVRGRDFRAQGAVVLMRQRNESAHFGIMSFKDNRWYVIHASNLPGVGMVVEEPLSSPFPYESRIAEIGDFCR
jgi:cell wall-associated NlpC family hydrolase